MTSSSINLHEVFEAGWTFSSMTKFGCDNGRDVGRILVADFWPPLLRGMEKTAGVDGMMTKGESIAKVKQEIERRLLDAAQQIVDTERVLKKEIAEESVASERLPSTPEDAIAFVGQHFNAMQTHREDGTPLDPQDVRFDLTAHDLLSAFDDFKIVNDIEE